MFGSRDGCDWIDGPAFVCLVAFLQQLVRTIRLRLDLGLLNGLLSSSHFTCCSRADEQGNAMGTVFAQIQRTGTI